MGSCLCKHPSTPKEGNAEYKYDDGSFYRGEWKNHKRHGEGILINLNENSYEYGSALKGIWVNNNFIRGSIITRDYTMTGEHYIKNTGFYNTCIKEYKKPQQYNGIKYEGYWKPVPYDLECFDTKLDGYCLMTDINGKKFKQIYDNGILRNHYPIKESPKRLTTGLLNLEEESVFTIV